MTEEQKVTAKRFRSEAEKDLFILRMLECTADLSDAEITQILSDDELRDIYSTSVDIKAAKRNSAEIDAFAEWQRFAPKLVKPHRWNVNLLTRVAAILISVLLVSAGIFYMTTGETTTQAPLVAQNDKPERQDSNIIEPLNFDSITIDENESASQVKPKQHHRVIKPIIATASKPQKTEAQQTIDVDEYIRIQQARMDNDLAMQNADAMVNQYFAMANINEAMQSALGDGYSMENEIVILIIP